MSGGSSSTSEAAGVSEQQQQQPPRQSCLNGTGTSSALPLLQELADLPCTSVQQKLNRYVSHASI